MTLSSSPGYHISDLPLLIFWGPTKGFASFVFHPHAYSFLPDGLVSRFRYLQLWWPIASLRDFLGGSIPIRSLHSETSVTSGNWGTTRGGDLSRSAKLLETCNPRCRKGLCGFSGTNPVLKFKWDQVHGSAELVHFSDMQGPCRPYPNPRKEPIDIYGTTRFSNKLAL